MGSIRAGLVVASVPAYQAIFRCHPLWIDESSKMTLQYVCFVCFFCICPTGSTPKGGPTESSPTTQATRDPWHYLSFMLPVPPPPPPPPYFCHASCIRSMPSLVLLSCTYILNQVSGLSLPCFPVVHIYLNPTNMNPSTLQTPNINSVSLLLPTQFHHQNNSKTSPLMYIDR